MSVGRLPVDVAEFGYFAATFAGLIVGRGSERVFFFPHIAAPGQPGRVWLAADIGVGWLQPPVGLF